MTLAWVAAGVVAKKLLPPGAQPEASIREIGGESDLKVGIERALKAQDSIGGIIDCSCPSPPAGLGEPFFDTLEGLLAHALFSIPAVKGIAFGNGFEAARLFGSQNNDPYVAASGKTKTNRSGGISGGISNGNPLAFHLAIKPASSTPAQQNTYHLKHEKQENMRIKGRHDLCIPLRVPVIVEAVSACILADLLLIEQRIPRIFSTHA